MKIAKGLTSKASQFPTKSSEHQHASSHYGEENQLQKVESHLLNEMTFTKFQTQIAKREIYLEKG